MKKKILYIIYISCGLVGCFLLFLTMFLNNNKLEIEGTTQINTEQSSPADVMDQYLSKNFGFRTQVISFYTRLQDNLFSTSSIDDVIIGKEGFLYYKDTVDDYCGTNKMSTRAIYNTSKTLELMQENINLRNGKMLFVVAPNKNSLYDYMPFYYEKSLEQSNWERLEQELDKVSYLDSFQLFRSKDECLYYKTDTHWNDLGAYAIFEQSLTLLDKPIYHKDVSNSFKDFAMVGDLQRMLYPGAKPNESQFVVDSTPDYQLLTNTRNFEQPYIETQNLNQKGSLLMFRDSFANNLIPHFSNQFQYAVYDKNIPYNLETIDKYNADTVIFEIAERNLNLIQESAPLFQAPVRDNLIRNNLTNELKKDLVKKIQFEKTNDWIKISGVLEQKDINAHSRIFLKTNGETYELTPQKIDGNEYGFCGYFKKIDSTKSIEIFVESTKEEAYYRSLAYEIEFKK